ncbi:alpha/beta fold hydrolase [Cytobacillus sp. Hm23]
MQLHYICEGTGQPIVFLHGGILSSRDYEEIVKLAAEEGYQAIAFDRPGYGHSDRPQGIDMNPNDQARMIHAAINAMGITKPIILVGHSWSGTMTLSYALQFPKDVAALVTLGAVMYKEGYPAEKPDLLSRIVVTPVLGSILLHMLLKSPIGKGLAHTTVTETFKPERVPEGYKEEFYALAFRPVNFRANREDVLAFPITSKKISEKYKEIKTPLLIMVGGNDPFSTTREQGQRLMKDIPHTQYKLIPNAGHMMPDIHPKLVLHHISTFFTEINIKRNNTIEYPRIK